MTYQLSLNEDQANIVVRALDLFTRIGIGQYEELVNLLRYTSFNNLPPQANMEQAEALLKEAKRVLFGHAANGSYGIHNTLVPDMYRQGFDIQQVLQKALRDEAQKRLSTAFPAYSPVTNEVYQASDKQPLAQVAVTA